MGVAASLFYSSSDPENSLDYRIRPFEEQEASQQARWNDLASFLLRELSSSSGYSTSSWLQGSYKFGTQVRPPHPFQEFDIDLGVYFRWPGSPLAGQFLPKRLKDLVQEALASYAADEDNEAVAVAEPKERCARIHFKDSFHIDIPAYHLNPDEDERALATETNGWETSDPKAVYVWWKDQFSENSRPRARRLVRYMKMWAMLKFTESDRPSSILLTVLVANGLGQVDPDVLTGDDEFLYAVAEEVLNAVRAGNWIANPVNAGENLNRLNQDQFANLKTHLAAFVSTAARALGASTKSESAEIWSELFGHFMPLPALEEVQADEVISKSLVPLQFNPQVVIQATHGPRTIQGFNSIGPIPRGCTLNFTLQNAASLPLGAVVKWTVRNAGDVAEAHNDLGHETYGLHTEEHSEYRGTHYMDVTVLLYGRSIGRRRVPVQISGFGFPRRNPPRPSYTRRS